MVAPSVARARAPLRIDGAVIGTLVAAALLLLPAWTGQHGFSWVDGRVIDDLPLRVATIALGVGAAAVAVARAAGVGTARPWAAAVAGVALVGWLAAIAILLATGQLPGMRLGSPDGPGLGGGWPVVAWGLALALCSLTIGPARGAVCIGLGTIVVMALIPSEPFEETLLFGPDSALVVLTIIFAAFAWAWAVTLGRHERRRSSLVLGLGLAVVPVVDAIWSISVHLGGGYEPPIGGVPISAEATIDVFLVAIWWMAAGLLGTGGSPKDDPDQVAG